MSCANKNVLTYTQTTPTPENNIEESFDTKKKEVKAKKPEEKPKEPEAKPKEPEPAAAAAAKVKPDIKTPEIVEPSETALRKTSAPKVYSKFLTTYLLSLCHLRSLSSLSLSFHAGVVHY